MRNRPLGSPRSSATPSSAASRLRKAGERRSSSLSPASVRETLRVVRLKRRTPSVLSSPMIAWLSAEREMPSAPAAFWKLRCRASVTRASSSLRDGLAIGENPAPGWLNWSLLYHQSALPTCNTGQWKERSHDKNLVHFRCLLRPRARDGAAAAGARRRGRRDDAPRRGPRGFADRLWRPAACSEARGDRSR